MEFRLARELGMTVAQLRQSMSEREFMEWIAFLSWERKKAELDKGGE